jgi:hypothetical protein
MPQIGQLPGAARTISGCIGQVYSRVSFVFVGVFADVFAADGAPIVTSPDVIPVVVIIAIGLGGNDRIFSGLA